MSPEVMRGIRTVLDQALSGIEDVLSGKGR
jgi:hypothetical protein